MTAAERREWRKKIHKIHYDARLARAREKRAAREAETGVTLPRKRHVSANGFLPIGEQQGGFFLFAETGDQAEANNALLEQRLREVRAARGYMEPEPYRVTKDADDLQLLVQLAAHDRGLPDTALEYDMDQGQELSPDPEWIAMEQESLLGETDDDALP